MQLCMLRQQLSKYVLVNGLLSKMYLQIFKNPLPVSLSLLFIHKNAQNSTMFSEIIAVYFMTDSYSKRNSEG